MQEVYDLIQSIAETDSTVLIRGETGTGKELVAQAIHFLSHRAERPFVKVNCSALSEGILESELFGHVKGAFTGAIRDKIGRFELAQGGTLFLDEIGDVTPAVQMKLLRAIEQKEIERVGESRSRQVDVRVVAATNRDLEALKDQGRFREDLYYRLKVVPVHLPPLRERRGDIPLLVDHFIEKFNQKMGRAIEGIIPEALSLLLEYPWPGNVRELENAIEYAFIKAKNKSISLRDFPWEVRQPQGREETRAREELTEPEALRRLLTQTGWRISESSRIMGIHRSTLWRKIRQYGIKPK
jgi:transcriptional regulator with GAF, ATPase, and Fis domain